MSAAPSGLARGARPQSLALEHCPAPATQARMAPAPQARRRDIDGLRAIAVLAVVVFHAFPGSLPGGFAGVDVFFVLSGFLISTLLLDDLRDGTFTFAGFYARRIRRLFPALLLVLAASFAFGWFALLAGEFRQLGKHIAAGAGFVANFALWSEAGYFDDAAATKPLLHLWSLGIEEQFYIAWPLLLWMTGQRRGLGLLLTALLALASFLLYATSAGEQPAAAFYSPQTRIWELLCGALLVWHPRQRERRPGTNHIADLSSGAGLLLLALAFWQLDPARVRQAAWALLPVAGTLLLIAAGPTAWINRQLLSRRLVVGLGLISYPLYLWHWPLLCFAHIVLGQPPSGELGMALMVLALLLAWLTWRLLEAPLRYGPHGRTKAVALTALMALIGALGYLAYSRNVPGHATANLGLDEAQIARERAQYWAGPHDRNYLTAARRVLLFGDSQAVDIYKALQNAPELGLKLYGLDHQCTAFSLPRKDLPEMAAACRRQFDGFIAADDLLRADVLIYSSYWSHTQEPEQAAATYRQVVERIRRINPRLQILFFGPKPLLGREWVSINVLTRNHRSALGMNEYLDSLKWIRTAELDYSRALARRLGVGYVDVVDIFCRDGCQFYSQQRFAHFDQTHWTTFGARLFYEKLRQTPGASAWVFGAGL